jgi:DNA-binding LytR/AlgR family response regulator
MKNKQNCSMNVLNAKRIIHLALKDMLKRYVNSSLMLPARQYFYLKRNSKIYKISISEITHVEVEGRYSYIFRNNEKFITSKSLKSMLNFLGDLSFIQSHRNTIVNKCRIKEIFPNDNLIVFDNGHKTIMSGRFKANLIKELNVIQ